MPAQEAVKAGPIRPVLDTQLKRYHRSYRRRLRKIAKSSVVLGDLIYTFPGLAIVLATEQGKLVKRKEAICLAADGKSLRAVAEAMELPYWLRKVPPEAFQTPLGFLPNSEAFNRRIANVIPADVTACRMWLQWLIAGNRLVGEDFALWLAGQKIYSEHGPGASIVLPLAAYAWFSQARGVTACGYIQRGWHGKANFVRAVDEARNFVLRLILDHCRDVAGQHGRWYATQRVSGYRFVPLTSARDLDNEGDRMNNCVGSYSSMVAKGDCLIYGIRRGNRHVATLEVRPNFSNGGVPVITQLEGPSNGYADEGVVRAADKWLKRQSRFPVIARNAKARVAVDPERWVRLWEPFWIAIGQQRARADAPVAPQVATMTSYIEELTELAKKRR